MCFELGAGHSRVWEGWELICHMMGILGLEIGVKMIWALLLWMYFCVGFPGSALVYLGTKGRWTINEEVESQFQRTIQRQRLDPDDFLSLASRIATDMIDETITES